jgi:hypothetical protein
MRQIEGMTYPQFFTRLSGAYKKMLGGKAQDSKLILRDIVGFAELGLYNPTAKCTGDELLELRGRQQMALHILQHLDIDAVSMMSLQNEAHTQGASFLED